ncbi:MAG: hypothetical protein KDC53_11345 [Saprospiraceae bacterium]|nr:hypothetical protein [Saprospiraceae bacterium]
MPIAFRNLTPYLLVFLGIFNAILLFAESPAIIHFSKDDNQSHKQNWQIGQLENGLMVFANTHGLMIYNGIEWRLYPMPHQEIVRTLYIDQDRIYVGSYGEFGFWKSSPTGQLIYTSAPSG